ncbi:MAG: aminoacetone oxidase family FAD-binding enzyme [Fimbriimonas sp.]|nr:aminoacetone oxidase family FAD-binding enzyme [Fimbriimonas sp.]
MRKPDVVVVGAGAAGILAAWRAASLGAAVLLLEKTERIGTKILISGGGKCNITHDGPLEAVLKAFRPNEARFIRPACYRFTNLQIVEMLTDRGLEVYTRPDGRIFPVDSTAKDVVRILAGYLDEAGVEVRLNCPVSGIEVSEGRVQGVKVGVNESILAHSVVLSVGGSSYPNSGTTGDGWVWARAIGHRVTKIRAALAPIYLNSPIPDLSGLSIRDCVVKARLAGKEISRWRGDMLLTHHGLSGPTILGISRIVAERMVEGPVTIEADVLPDDTFESLAASILSWAQTHPKRLVSTYLDDIVPKNAIEPLMRAAKVANDTVAARLDKSSRNRLVTTMKGWSFGEARAVPLEKGEVVAGGISLDEVDPHTMESRIVEGLFVCGEVLDVAGPVGGYNLQAAFATGYVGGESAATFKKT